MNLKNFVCPHCGASVDQGPKFCSRCGAALVPQSPEKASRAARFWNGCWQFLFALGALGFGGVGACSAYVLATHQAMSRDIGDLSPIYWGVGLMAAGCCALCLTLIYRRRRP